MQGRPAVITDEEKLMGSHQACREAPCCPWGYSLCYRLVKIIQRLRLRAFIDVLRDTVNCEVLHPLRKTSDTLLDKSSFLSLAHLWLMLLNILYRQWQVPPVQHHYCKRNLFCRSYAQRVYIYNCAGETVEQNCHMCTTDPNSVTSCDLRWDLQFLYNRSWAANKMRSNLHMLTFLLSNRRHYGFQLAQKRLRLFF